MRYILPFCAGLCACSAYGQNLVPNPSFEQVTSCPTFSSQLDLAAPWYNPTAGTPELYHGCAPNGSFAGVPSNSSGGFQYARTGEGFAGIYTYREASPEMREYIEVPLLQPLVAGRCYSFSMYVNMPNDFELASDGIGAYLSTGPVESGNQSVLPLVPQISNPAGQLITDTLGWTAVSGNYTAAGGETHLTIGNFRGDANTAWAMFNPGVWNAGAAYLLVDDVSLIPVPDPLDLGPDTALCGANYVLDATVEDAVSTLWNDGVTTAQRIVTGPGTYSVQVDVGGCMFKDTVVVNMLPLPMLELGGDLTLCPGQHMELNAQAGAGTEVVWEDGSTGLAHTVHAPGLYTASASNDCGTITDSVKVTMEDCPDGIYLPNAFTPNGDGINDVYTPVADPRVWDVGYTVFDRWGHVVFNGSNGSPWNGGDTPSGLYEVQLTARSHGDRKVEKELMAHVTLLR